MDAGVVGSGDEACLEAWTGSTLFVDSESFRPLVEAHLAGGMVGVVAAVVSAISANEELR